MEDGWTWKFDPAIWQRFSMPDLDLLLPRIACPAAVMWGERSALMREETLDYMFGEMPDDVLRVAIPDADHHGDGRPAAGVRGGAAGTAGGGGGRGLPLEEEGGARREAVGG